MSGTGLYMKAKLVVLLILIIFLIVSLGFFFIFYKKNEKFSSFVKNIPHLLTNQYVREDQLEKFVSKNQTYENESDQDDHQETHSPLNDPQETRSPLNRDLEENSNDSESEPHLSKDQLYQTNIGGNKILKLISEKEKSQISVH